MSYFKPLNEVEKAFSRIDLDSSFHIFQNFLSEAVFDGLEMCDAKLSESRKKISQEELSSIQEEIEKLIDEVKSTDMPEKLKEILLTKSKDIMDAMIKYRIWGIDGLENCLDSSIGGIRRNKRLFEDNFDDNNEHITSFYSIVNRLLKIVNLGKGLTELTNSIKELL